MFDIRKIQEQVIYNAVAAESDDAMAHVIVDGNQENNPTWVKNTMKRLERHFDKSAVKRIRINCQCGYGMDEKLSLLKKLMDCSFNCATFNAYPSSI